MATGAWCGVAPFLFRKKHYGFEGKEQARKSFKASKNHKQMKGTTVSKSCGVAGNFIKMPDIRKKILTLRDLVDLSPCIGSASVNELLIWTLKDLLRLYPSIKPSISLSGMEGASMNQVLCCFCDVLRSLGDSWANNSEWMTKSKYDASVTLDQDGLEKLAQAMLEDTIKLARERMFDMMDEDEQMNDYDPSENAFRKSLSESYPDSKTSLSSSPATPTSVLPEMRNILFKGTKPSYSPPLLLQLRVQAVEKLNPIDVKHLSFHMLSHAVAQDPNYLVQKSETIEERQTAVKPKLESKAKSVASIEVNQDFKMEEDTTDTLMTTLDKSASNAGKNLTGNAYLDSERASYNPPKEDIDVVPPPTSLPKLRSNISEKENPPPSPAEYTLSPNAKASQVSTQLPPPPPPMFSRNEVLSIRQRPTPSETTSYLKTGPRPPPLPPPPPPPPLSSNANGSIVVIPPSPPPPSAISGITTPPPLPPPLSMASGKIAPPPPFGTSNRGPPPQMLPAIGGAPPPPPGLEGTKNLRLRKAATKLKRSPQMGNLYRLLKGQVEGCNLDAKSSRKGKIGSSTGVKQGMADALAEMTKRSTYFQQIEEDVKNHEKSIRELKASINSFQSTNMAELRNFHKHIESILEKLTDETQVLARFEDFPTKKLEALRMASAFYSKLDTIVTTLKNWQIKYPVSQVIDKIEIYFNKIKQELDALERTKDEESKRFRSHKIEFDFSILIHIKELMVDVSSSCMEQALKEKRDAKAMENAETGAKTESQKKGSAKVLWKAFQFAYRVYTFAGGHDDRADQLARELATEIQTDPYH